MDTWDILLFTLFNLGLCVFVHVWIRIPRIPYASSCMYRVPADHYARARVIVAGERDVKGHEGKKKPRIAVRGLPRALIRPL